MSIKLDAHEGREPEGLSLAFHLQLQGEAGQLSLMTPLGTQMAEIRWDAQQAVLRDSEGEQQYPSLEELSAALLGEVLPLAVLPYWLDGQADPATPSTPSPQAEGFEQLGWHIDLSGQARDLIVARRPASVEQRGITLRARLLLRVAATVSMSTGTWPPSTAPAFSSPMRSRPTVSHVCIGCRPLKCRQGVTCHWPLRWPSA